MFDDVAEIVCQALVTESTLATLRSELKRGERICRQCEYGETTTKKPPPPEQLSGGVGDASGGGGGLGARGGGGGGRGGAVTAVVNTAVTAVNTAVTAVVAAATPWSELLEPLPFFSAYRHFLCVEVATSPGEAVSGHHLWDGWAESRLRWLVLAVEKVSRGALQVHPWPHPHQAVTAGSGWGGEGGRVTTRFLGLRPRPGSGGSGASAIAAGGLDNNNGNNGGGGGGGSGAGAGVAGVDLQGAVDEFRSIVNAWPGRVSGMRQGLPFFHFLAQPEPFSS